MRAGFLLLSLSFAVSGQPFGASTLLRNADGGNEALAGVAKFDNCTGFVVRPSASTPSSAPAYLVTAGHCIDQGVTTVVRGRALTGRFATFRYFIDTVPQQVRVRAVEAVYSTMKGTDLAVVRLEATLADLTGRGIRAFPLAAETPGSGEGRGLGGRANGELARGGEIPAFVGVHAGAVGEVVEGRWHWWSLLRE